MNVHLPLRFETTPLQALMVGIACHFSPCRSLKFYSSVQSLLLLFGMGDGKSSQSLFFFNYFLVLFCNRKHPRNIMFGEECILADYFVASCLRFRFAFAHAGMHSLPNTVYCIIGDTWILPNAPLEHVCVRGWNHQFFLGSLLCKTKKRKKYLWGPYVKNS